MFIQIDRASTTPIQRQIIDQIRAQCAGGKLQPGDRLPSSRSLADQTGVHYNTVLQAYESLAAEGIIEMRSREGAFVAQAPPESSLDTHRAELTNEIQRLIRRSLSLGIAPDEFLDLFENAIASALPEAPEEPEALP